MSIFRRDGSPDSQETPAATRVAPSAQDRTKKTATYIAPGSTVSGEINGSAELLVDGRFEGRVKLEAGMIVGREGRVEGEVVARSVRVEGKVIGNVRGLERVEVTTSGSLEGDISASRVVIAEGAFFKGNVEMTGKESGRPKASASGGQSAGAAGGGGGGSQPQKQHGGRKGGR